MRDEDADFLFASDGEDIDEHRRFRASTALEGFPYVVAEELGRSYGVGKIPYAVLIDRTGHIASMGMVNSREHLESLFSAQELGLASVQEFVKNADAD